MDWVAVPERIKVHEVLLEMLNLPVPLKALSYKSLIYYKSIVCK
jgi:hypothetical protein